MADTPLASNGTHAEPMVTKTEALRTYTQLFQRIAMTRAGITFSGDRDLYTTLGYKRTLDYEDYYERYCRGGIAARIIDAFPAATWRIPPAVREKDKADETVASPFEAAWEALATRLNVWKFLARTDRLASIGHYAVLVIGLRGQTEWGSEAVSVRSPDDVLYLNAYSEDHARITQLVSLDTSPLFGQPGRYDIDFSRHMTGTVYDAVLRPSLGSGYGSTVAVHASRLIHVAENGLEDDIVGTPRLRAVWNYLDDLEKIAGGAGEMFWQDAKRRMVLSLDADATLSTESADALTEEVEQFTHELRNFLRVQGMTVTQLAGQIPDPSDHIDTQFALIAGTVGMPKRKLIGNEQGELASDQDENNWNATIMERQQQYAEPMLLRPLIDRLIALGALPAPQGGYVVEWANLLALTEEQRATVAETWTKTIAAYAGTLGSPQDIVPLEIFLEDILEFDKEQVQRILELLATALEPDDEVLVPVVPTENEDRQDA